VTEVTRRVTLARPTASSPGRHDARYWDGQHRLWFRSSNSVSRPAPPVMRARRQPRHRRVEPDPGRPPGDALARRRRRGHLPARPRRLVAL